MSFQQLILLVFAKTVQGKYSLTTNKSLGFASFSHCKILKPTASIDALLKTNYITNIFFCNYSNIESKHKN